MTNKKSLLFEFTKNNLDTIITTVMDDVEIFLFLMHLSGFTQRIVIVHYISIYKNQTPYNIHWSYFYKKRGYTCVCVTIEFCLVCGRCGGLNV